MKGKDAVAQILKAEGVEHLMCFPDNAVIDAAAALDIRPIIARTERVAINIADGFSRVSNGRRIGVAAVQYAGGIENAFAGVAQAYGDASPILILPGGYERAEQGVPPNFRAVDSYANVAKWAEFVHQADRIPHMMRRAFTLLRSGKPGPVLLEIPTDVMDEPVCEACRQYAPVRARRSQGDPADVREAVRALLAAKSPVIVAGQGVFYAEACAELREFAELVQAPVLTTLNGKSAFPEDHPLALGAGGRSRPRTVDHFLDRADLVFGVGTSFTRSTYNVELPPGKTIAQVTNSEADLSKDYAVSYGAIGDAKLVLRQMIEEARCRLGAERRRDGRHIVEAIRAVKADFMKAWWPRLTCDDAPISPYRVIWELMRAVDRARTIVTHDSGHPRDQMVPFYEAVIPHGYIGWGKTTQLGTGLGLAMGAKLARPDCLCVNLMGDAAFGMVGMDFETAVRLRIPILTIVMNNGLMGGYDKFLPISTEKYGARYLSGNFSKVADGLGGYTERVEKPEHLAPALRRCIAEVEAGRAALLEVITREEPALALGKSSRYQ
ncbi:MAG: thiamine pyrophosphate-requiring protein [Anaerolineae bacterium]|nr:thiamine pyrophosphate-requiring protein [Candidatus Roseilinea sp.]MDW8448404.1 thiamine pyrophosphate-requiring protein [Anaerolineae bacterium]